jgi:hypothetical protein
MDQKLHWGSNHLDFVLNSHSAVVSEALLSGRVWSTRWNVCLMLTSLKLREGIIDEFHVAKKEKEINR